MEKGRKEVAVIGGSLGGLMHAIALKQLGHNVRILDQTPYEVRESQAAGIFCGPYVREFCAVHGIDIDSIALYRSGMQELDRLGKVKGKYPYSAHYTSWSVVYHMLRAHFDGYTSEACPIPLPAPRPQDGTTIYDAGKGVYDVERASNGRQIVHFKDVKNDETKSIEVDLVIAADGANSTIRKKKTGSSSIDRKYAGYIAWRGTIAEKDLTKETMDLFKNEVSLIGVTPDSYMVVYIIPSDKGKTALGSRSINWIWYYPLAKDSQSWVETMTDTDDHLHATTVATGKVRSFVWERMMRYSRSLPLSPPLAELIDKTPAPLITAIADVDPPTISPVFDNDSLFLVGEAFSLPRPHSASSTNQAAWHALNLVKVLKGQITSKEWEYRARYYADYNNCWSKFLGSKFMLGKMNAAYWGARFLYAKYYGKFWGYG